MSSDTTATTQRTPCSRSEAAQKVDGTYDKDGAQAAALTAFRKLRADRRFTDFIIKCGMTEHKVHKSVLSATAEWFDTPCGGGFKVTSPWARIQSLLNDWLKQEAETGILDLSEDPEGIVAALVQFCYEFTYDEPAEAPMTFHVRMFDIGERYTIPDLQALAARKFELSSVAKWSTEDFAVATREIYENDVKNARAFKMMISQISADRSAELFGTVPEDGDDHFRGMVQSLPGYAMDVLRETNNVEKRKKEKEVRKYACIGNPACSGYFVVDRPELPLVVTNIYHNCVRCEIRYRFKDGEMWEVYRLT